MITLKLTHEQADAIADAIQHCMMIMEDEAELQRRGHPSHYDRGAPAREARKARALLDWFTAATETETDTAAAGAAPRHHPLTLGST